MPCYDSRDDDDRRDTQQRADDATRAACDLARVLHHYRPETWKELQRFMHKSTLDWVRKHDEADARRLRQETEEQNRQNLIAAAKAKLTLSEKKLLGLK